MHRNPSIHLIDRLHASVIQNGRQGLPGSFSSLPLSIGFLTLLVSLTLLVLNELVRLTTGEWLSYKNSGATFNGASCVRAVSAVDTIGLYN